ncbi:MAG: hypothetical protein EXS51_04040 [Candidatus Taylorbacteria bacterium]|nr:hypothetical protein [Candidatus Taylorbacteria bacterium]
MKQHDFALFSGSLFLIIGIAHLARVVLGWSVQIDGWNVPVWCSYVAVLVAGYLAFHGLKLSQKR